MVDSILNKTAQPPGTIARLKVSQPSPTQDSTALNSAEQQLADILDLSPEARTQVQNSRKANAYLSIFGKALKIINGWSAKKAYVPQFSKVEVEFVPSKGSIVKKEA